MAQYIDKDALVAEIERRKYQFVSQAEAFRKIGKEDKESYFAALASNMNSLSCFLNTLEVKESDETASDETAKAFARIIRANLTGIDKDVQYKFEQLYKEITGKKMYQGYSD